MSEVTGVPDPIAVKLQPFLQRHPFSKLEHRESPTGIKHSFILDPWGDDSLVLGFETAKVDGFTPTLNGVLLPQRFTAVYHIETKTMEFIFDVLDPVTHPEFGMQFVFRWRGRDYQCKFSNSSNVLMQIAMMFMPRRRFDSNTEFRNLRAFRDFQIRESLPESVASFFENKQPTSFFVEGLDTYCSAS